MQKNNYKIEGDDNIDFFAELQNYDTKYCRM